MLVKDSPVCSNRQIPMRPSHSLNYTRALHTLYTRHNCSVTCLQTGDQLFNTSQRVLLACFLKYVVEQKTVIQIVPNLFLPHAFVANFTHITMNPCICKKNSAFCLWYEVGIRTQFTRWMDYPSANECPTLTHRPLLGTRRPGLLVGTSRTQMRCHRRAVACHRHQARCTRSRSPRQSAWMLT